jgi:hypothetical protein
MVTGECPIIACFATCLDISPCYAFSHYGMSFTPHLDATWQHEFMTKAGASLSSSTVRELGSSPSSPITPFRPGPPTTSVNRFKLK